MRADAHHEAPVDRYSALANLARLHRFRERFDWQATCDAFDSKGEVMFRVEMLDGADALVMKIEGQLSAGFAEHAGALLDRCNAGTKLVVDLTDVTFVDSRGEEVLSHFGRIGAEFVADTAYSRDLCERLDLSFRPAAVRLRKPR